jgi:hypothetical protein
MIHREQLVGSTRATPRSPLDPDVARLVEGIALTLAAEHHALEIAQGGLPCIADMGSDRPSSPRAS